mmetsp:Transcript_12773/g.19689  ORF Transcript_12773/g.19689 Transcript_12773/m.19689 type:complete len:217 (-) Transcript_12773:37-687(-)
MSISNQHGPTVINEPKSKIKRVDILDKSSCQSSGISLSDELCVLLRLQLSGGSIACPARATHLCHVETRTPSETTSIVGILVNCSFCHHWHSLGNWDCGKTAASLLLWLLLLAHCCCRCVFIIVRKWVIILRHNSLLFLLLIMIMAPSSLMLATMTVLAWHNIIIIIYSTRVLFLHLYRMNTTCVSATTRSLRRPPTDHKATIITAPGLRSTLQGG